MHVVLIGLCTMALNQLAGSLRGYRLMDVVPPDPARIAERLISPEFVGTFLGRFGRDIEIGKWEKSRRQVSYKSDIRTPFGSFRCTTTCKQCVTASAGVASDLVEDLVIDGIPFVGQLQMKRSWSLRLQKDERVHLLVDFELQSRIPWFAESIVRGEIAKQTSETFDAATKE